MVGIRTRVESRSVGAFLAVFALWACAPALAQANPTAFACVKASPAKTGKYADNECSEGASGGRYERASAVGDTYTSKTGEVVFNTPDIGVSLGETITCKKATDRGVLSGPSVGEDAIIAVSCATDGKRCRSSGAPAGKIVFNVKTEFVGPPTSAKIKLTPIGLRFECEGLLVRVGGFTEGAYTAPAAGHANKKSIDILGGEKDLTMEASDDGGSVWIGEEFGGFAAEERATSENTSSEAIGLE